jgi:hypothetical protein
MTETAQLALAATIVPSVTIICATAVQIVLRKRYHRESMDETGKIHVLVNSKFDTIKEELKAAKDRIIYLEALLLSSKKPGDAK